MATNTIATIQGTIQNDAFYFPLDVNGQTVPNMVLDTGAFELTFNGTVAQQLGLPLLQPIQIGGVGGSATAYQSVCNISLGGQQYTNVPCIIDPNFSLNGLFGLRFFVDNQLTLTLDTTTQELTISSSVSPTGSGAGASGLSGC